MAKINKLFIPYIIFIILLGSYGDLFPAFLIVSFHEIMHCITALTFGISAYEFELLPIGAVLRLKELDSATPFQDIVISISAPAVNIILAFILFLIGQYYNSYYLNIFFRDNLLIGIFNLIPALPLDGGRILRDGINSRILYKKADMITVKISITIGIGMIAYFLFLILCSKFSLNILMIALFIIISSIKEKERIVYFIMGDIIKKKYNFIKRGYIENRGVSIYYKWDLLKVLGIVDKNKYSIFYVLDDEMEVLDVIYEVEIIEGLKNYGNISFEEFIKKREELDL